MRMAVIASASEAAERPIRSLLGDELDDPQIDRSRVRNIFLGAIAYQVFKVQTLTLPSPPGTNMYIGISLWTEKLELS